MTVKPTQLAGAVWCQCGPCSSTQNHDYFWFCVRLCICASVHPCLVACSQKSMLFLCCSAHKHVGTHTHPHSLTHTQMHTCAHGCKHEHTQLRITPKINQCALDHHLRQILYFEADQAVCLKPISLQETGAFQALDPDLYELCRSRSFNIQLPTPM